MNELKKEIQVRYGSFELSHQKNEDIVNNIEEFIDKIVIAFTVYIGTLIQTTKDGYTKLYLIPTIKDRWVHEKELFEHFKNNIYGKN